MRGLIVKSSRSERTARHDSKVERENGCDEKDRRENRDESRQPRRGWWELRRQGIERESPHLRQTTSGYRFRDSMVQIKTLLEEKGKGGRGSSSTSAMQSCVGTRKRSPIITICCWEMIWRSSKFLVILVSSMVHTNAFGITREEGWESDQGWKGLISLSLV